MDIKTFLNHWFAFMLVVGTGLFSLYRDYLAGTINETDKFLFYFGSVFFMYLFIVYVYIFFRRN